MKEQKKANIFVWFVAFQQFIWETLKPWARVVWVVWQVFDATIAAFIVLNVAFPIITGAAGIAWLTESAIPTWVIILTIIACVLGWIVALIPATLFLGFFTLVAGAIAFVIIALLFRKNLIELATVKSSDSEASE